MAPWSKHGQETAGGTVETTHDGRKIFRPRHHLKAASTSPRAAAFKRFTASMNPATLFQRKATPAVPRTIYINTPLDPGMLDKKGRPRKETVYPTNQNVTSKYTILTFLPRNLFEQFRRVANGECTPELGPAGSARLTPP